MRGFGEGSWLDGHLLRGTTSARGEARGLAERFAGAFADEDGYDAEHAREVARLALLVGLEMGLSGLELDALELGALLHDVGKVGVPSEILAKPGPLEEEEYELVKRHPEIGARMLEPVESLSSAIPAVRHHHENFDGTGYPGGLSGEGIPLAARIVGVADAFDVMVRGRRYRRPVTAEEALGELWRGSGARFDPRVVEAFRRAI